MYQQLNAEPYTDRKKAIGDANIFTKAMEKQHRVITVSSKMYFVLNVVDKYLQDAAGNRIFL